MQSKKAAANAEGVCLPVCSSTSAAFEQSGKCRIQKAKISGCRMKKGPERMGIETSARDRSARRRRLNKWLCCGGPASDSGLYLKLVTRVYWIEKVGFRWYCLLKFLRIQTAKRSFIVSFRKR